MCVKYQDEVDEQFLVYMKHIYDESEHTFVYKCLTAFPADPSFQCPQN